jgi:PadR family transcriptional regulator, regulatory protein PadR
MVLEGAMGYPHYPDERWETERSLRAMGWAGSEWTLPLLLVCLRDAGIARGFELKDDLAAAQGGGVNPMEVYRTLRQMEEEGLVLSARDGGEHRLARRWFEITDQGRAYLEFWADSLKKYQEEMDAFFEIYERSPLAARQQQG